MKIRQCAIRRHAQPVFQFRTSTEKQNTTAGYLLPSQRHYFAIGKVVVSLTLQNIPSTGYTHALVTGSFVSPAPLIPLRE